MIELTLPYPPSVNNYKRVGRLTKTKNGKLYQPRVNTNETNMFYFQVAMRVRDEGLKIYRDETISLEVHMDVYPPDHRARDVDNIIKPCLDSLQRAGVIANDFQIARLVVQRCEIIPQGLIKLRIMPSGT